MSTVAIIPARGGSKGIPRKNIYPMLGKPLIAWSIEQALKCDGIDSVWVTSDSDEILSVAEEYGASPLVRSAEIAGDLATSESAWIDALNQIESSGVDVSVLVGMQATSPVRESSDLKGALEKFKSGGYDSLLSVTLVEDYFVWRKSAQGLESVNYDFKSRKRRQEIQPSYLENGSFYVFTPTLLRETNNRLGGKIGMFELARHKMYQVDTFEDIALIEAIIKGYELNK
ncbi:MAG: CMP-N,N'-diacetyllegionaminic acid synthase [Candidatus Azotimanducaceae bacterium]|jgi:CMP-N,N'-diacetyllegionaminic acid synthase